ncbi:TPA: hypothetical protein N0F65_009728 [Lagenidium giganteum]|uniref:3'-5' exonuclease domain-containing protein n=1 Tax=Lagenidium giganteum TaxID=4803 RepID=A0AAV2YIB5_9STRA|nr:TPA: hypothetical protein N0F65_009728 [Lagenidium giganteum]
MALTEMSSGPHAHPRRPSAPFYWRKVVRDLLWSISSPHMLAADHFPLLDVPLSLDSTAATSAWLHDLQRNPSHLTQFLMEKTRTARTLALGVYFAALFEYWLRFCPALQVAKFEVGKQIVSATGQTLGQLKFLFRRLDTAQDHHVECSVKFFLLHPLSTNASTAAVAMTYPLEQFVGPHLGENLAWRAQEVTRKLAMCRGDSVQAWLRDHYSDSVQSHVVLRGYLFYPLSHFASTSEVNHRHDWQLHRNTTTTNDQKGPCVDTHNAAIASDHLRGWWTADWQRELVAKVQANDHAVLGASRFAVLPKLHWLAPVIATESEDATCVTIDGDDELAVETVDVLTLDQLVERVKLHFESLAEAEETQAKGGVVMPLLIAELVRCREVDVEFSSSCARWKELSRGFVMDPKCWDPRPLCHEPVRYRRTNTTSDAVTEREYEGRKEWHHHGVIKPTDDELAQQQQTKKLQVFEDLASVSPELLCTRIADILRRNMKTYPHAMLKQAIQRVLLLSPQDLELDGRSDGRHVRFVMDCLDRLVLASGIDDDEAERKVLQRVGHLILDAVEAVPAAQLPPLTPEQAASPWSWIVKFMDAVVATEARWCFLNLVLRGCGLMRQLVNPTLTLSKDEQQQVMTRVTQLLDAKSVRWNAMAVEALCVFGLLHQDNAASVRPIDLLTTLLDQSDWKSAEQLVMNSDSVEMLEILYQRLSAVNMIKAMKRLRKAFERKMHVHLASSEDQTTAKLRHYNGPAVDHVKNRALCQHEAMQWTYVDTTDQVDAMVQQLEAIAARPTHSASTVIIGLDCEWRPRFLRKNAELQNDTKRLSPKEGDDDDDAEEEQEEVVDDDEGLSVYQLAIEGHVFVVDVLVLGQEAARPLQCIWDASSPFLLTGFCVTGDLKRLSHSFPVLLLHSATEQDKLLVELKQLALYRQVPAAKWGLSQLYEECLGQSVDKEEQCSDWGSRPLSRSQKEYAAKDAYAVRNLALHLVADVAAESEPGQLRDLLKRFAVVTNPRDLNATATFGHWISSVAPMAQQDVADALDRLGLSNATAFHTIPKEAWDGSAYHPAGLIVKTIALAVRPRGAIAQYLAVVVRVDRSIDIGALSQVIQVEESALSLVDKETLVRVFGYTRGCVGPIGLREHQDIRVVVDQQLLQESAILCGAGTPDVVYAIAPPAVIAATSALVAAIACD